MKYTKILIFILFCFLFISCSKIQNLKKDDNINKLPKDEYFIEQDVYDPFEGINRRVYYFNSKVDKYFILPISNIYSTYTPNLIQDSIHNFFLNLNEVPVFINSLLQKKADKSMISFARFGINSTLGILGLFDIASNFNIERYDEDFGQTLGYYGVPTGPYIVLPILGPSNARDLSGKIIHSYTLNYTDPLILANSSQKNIEILAINGIDIRSHLNFQYYQSGSAFEYDYVRFLYSKVQKIEIKK